MLQICDQCGTRLLPQARFCANCAAPVIQPPFSSDAERLRRLVPQEYAERLLAARGPVPGERRTVTILFCDVIGSTALAETLDPEDVLDIMNGAFEVLIEPITRYEGTLARLMGDAVLAFFGAPTAHEDDALRACLAALGIIAGVRQYAAELARERGICSFDVRVGIHTGLVVVGEVGTDLRVEYTAMGDAVNLAARLEQAAEPGTVLVSDDTHRLVAGLFETEALGQIEVKGRTGTVPAYCVLAARPAAGKPRGIAGLESPLVGREAEFRALQVAVERLQAGEGGVVTIVGEAGIGKSRLVAEARNAGATHLPGALHLCWVEGRCLSYGASIAYLLWIDVLRGLLDVSAEAAPAEIESALTVHVTALCPQRFDDVYPYLARLLSLPLPDEVERRLQDLDGRELRDRIFRAVETFAACTASRRPLALICEDLHWSDPTSLQLLEHLLPLTRRASLLLICVFRPRRQHRSWKLRETAEQYHAERHTSLYLEPLSSTESQALVANLLSIEDLPQELKARILSRAEGNPFFVEEILRSLIDSGAIIWDGGAGRWHAGQDVGAITIPDTLQGVLLARIDRLQEETRRVLQLASVIGRIFLYRILSEIVAAEAAACEEQQLDRRLATLQQEEMIRERARLPELEYIFKHDLTREAAYNGLLKRDRRDHHRQVAEALERIFPSRVEEMLGLLAHHWERAGVAEQAVDYLQRAGDQARLAYSHEEAVSYYERALAFLREAKETDRAARLLMKLGLTYHNAFRYAEARRAHEEGFRLWQQAAKVPPAALPPAPHALRLAPYDPHTLDPSTGDDMALLHLFSGLVQLTPDASIVPDVAQSWDILDGGCTYVFRLRDDVRWSDGVPVTAGDFECAWKRVLDPATGSQHAGLLYDVKGARAFHLGEIPDPDTVGVWARNDLTLVVELESPVAYFLQVSAHAGTLPVPRHLVEKLGRDWAEPESIVTNGSFHLQSWQRGESMVLVRNPNYHGSFSGNVQQVRLFGQATLNDRELVRMYQAGELDHLYFGFLSLSEALRAQRRYASDYILEPHAALFYYGFDVTRPPFDDIRVRRAFALATDPGALLTSDIVRPAMGGFVPPGIPGHQPGIGLANDLERAQQLLIEAGYAHRQGFPEIECLLLSGGFGEGWRTLQESQWVDGLGIKMRWSALPSRDWRAKFLEEPPHVFVTLWAADYPDPDNFLRVGFPWEWTGWSDVTYMGLLEEARHTMDQDQRLNLYRQADRLLIEEAVVVPMEYGGHPWLVKPWLTRLRSAIAQRFMFWQDVVIEPH